MLREGGDVHAIDRDASREWVVKAEDEAQDGRLAAPGLPHQRERLAALRFEVQVAEHRRAGDVLKAHAVELHGAGAHGQRFGVGLVLDARVRAQQLKHVLHVDHVLLDGAVVGAEEIERRIELVEHRDKQHDIAHRELAGSDALHADDHAADEAGADDKALHDVERVEAGQQLVLHLLVLLDRRAKVAALQLLVGEVLDGFVVEQRVGGLGAFGVVLGVHVPAEVPPPLREDDGERDVGGQGDKDHHADPGRQLPGDEDGGKHDVKHLRSDAEHHDGEQVLDGAGAAVHHAHHLARLALEVEAEVEVQHLGEQVDADALVGALRDGDPQVGAQVLDEAHAAAAGAALDDVKHEPVEAPGEERGREGHHAAALAVGLLVDLGELVDGVGVQDRHHEVEPAHEDDEHHAHQRARLEPNGVGPHVRERQHAQLEPALGLLALGALAANVHRHRR
mmetsp:Transcript_20292/g.51104  ORF Transcript_20292/g.51104 Transcript_20292/m.51104 type:complete len:451 (-) Transcript_20292:471-1823(-)